MTQSKVDALILKSMKGLSSKQISQAKSNIDDRQSKSAQPVCDPDHPPWVCGPLRMISYKD